MRALIVIASVVVGCAGSAEKLETPSPGRCASQTTVHGDVRLTHARAVQRMSGCAEVVGDVVIKGSVSDVGPLDQLQRITGTLTIESALRLESAAALGALQKIGGALIVRDNYTLNGLFLGALTVVGGEILIRDNATLRNVSLHRVRSAGGHVRVIGNADLWRIDLGTLQSIRGKLIVRDNRRLESLEVGALKTVDAREVELGSKAVGSER